MLRGHAHLLSTVLSSILYQHQAVRRDGHCAAEVFSTGLIHRRIGFYSSYTFSLAEKHEMHLKSDNPYVILLCTQKPIVILFFWSSLSALY